MPDPKAPVTILGAGIVGICTALSLRERGVPVTIMDRRAPGQETSYGNAGVVSPYSCVPQALPGIWKQIPKLMLGPKQPVSVHPGAALPLLAWGARFLRQSQRQRALKAANAMADLCGPCIELFEKHLRGTGHEGLLVDSAYVQAYRDASKATLKGLEAQIRADKGARMEVLGQDQLRQLEPALSPDFKAAVLVKGAARMRAPGRAATVLADKAQAMGVQFVRAHIKQIDRRDGGWTLRGADTTYAAERLVICLGIWSADLLRDLGVPVPVLCERGYHGEFAAPGVELNNSILDVDAKFVASTMEGGLRVAGQSEFAPPQVPPSRRREQRLLRAAKAAFPDLQTEQVSFWMGRRPSFPDSLPMIDQIANQPGLYVNFGHAHYGLMMAPASGELTAQLVCATTPNRDPSPFSSRRFAGPYINGQKS